jgi:hypothetical protein
VVENIYSKCWIKFEVMNLFEISTLMQEISADFREVVLVNSKGYNPIEKCRFRISAGTLAIRSHSLGNFSVA